MSLSDEISRLADLRRDGTLSEEEFQEAKRRLLAEDPSDASAGRDGLILGFKEEMWCTLMHVSQLLNGSLLGVVVPIAMWYIGQDSSDLVRRHGNRMMNWLISSFVYGVVFVLLALVWIGIPLFLLLVLLSIVFPIMAAVKSHQGKIWSYPLCIRFFPED